MLGDSGLGDFQGSLKLTDTHFLVLEHLDNFHPVRIGKGFHDLNKMVHAEFSLIFLDGNIVIYCSTVK